MLGFVAALEMRRGGGGRGEERDDREKEMEGTLVQCRIQYPTQCQLVRTHLSLSISCCLKFLKAKSSILWMNDSGTGCTDNCTQGEQHSTPHPPSHPHTHTPSHPHTHTLTHTHPLTLTHTLSPSHTHSLTHTLTHTHSHTHTPL